MFHLTRLATTSVRLNRSIIPRAFSTTAIMAKNEYLCILPDKEGVIEKRVEVRGVHLEGVKPLVADGTIVMGGAMLESHPAEGEPVPFKGSALLLLAESVEEAREALSKDIYARTGVWDMEKVQIIPFKSAVRMAL